jgi:hypothetical protein
MLLAENEAFWDADTPDDIKKIQTFLQNRDNEQQTI